ncbi:hypothetical protein CYMTET_9322 [Cymbomonas tetramitiformis]|uniref:Peptidase M24 domain-containing protein n=1 Tax=Cymbomonas tetramitiformis TaxID=36881 RepID=A0AAE0LF01_9CHLO|nr:hypothetical protein CYMTET_9322 [Cymbomonas tetramitiformis]
MVAAACKVCVECMRAAIEGIRDDKLKTGLQVADKVGEIMLKNRCHSACMCDGDGFKHACCVSVNDCVAHGVPSDKPFFAGDVITVDLVVHHGNGYMGDMARTIVHGVDETHSVVTDNRNLLETIIRNYNESDDRNYLALESAIVTAYDDYDKLKHGRVVRTLTGHYIGQRMHMLPSIGAGCIASTTHVLKPGDTMCIEPVCVAHRDITQLTDDRVRVEPNKKDEYIASTADHVGAHHENTYEVMTDLRLQCLTEYNV